MRHVLRNRPGRLPFVRLGSPGVALALALAAGLAAGGCGGGSGLGGGGISLDGSGLQLPPDFTPVDLPDETRREIFREASIVRARAVHEANRRLPMDAAHLPVDDQAAFDARVAEHRAIIDEVLEANLAELAGRYKISTEDLAKIEDEARMLRWLPPEDPRPIEEPGPAEEAAPGPSGEADGDSPAP